MIIDTTIIQVEKRPAPFEREGGKHPSIATVLRRSWKSESEHLRRADHSHHFIPILSLEGIEGKMFGPLAITVAIALLPFVFLSIFVIRALHHVSEAASGERKRHHEAREELYLPLLTMP